MLSSCKNTWEIRERVYSSGHNLCQEDFSNPFKSQTHTTANPGPALGFGPLRVGFLPDGHLLTAGYALSAAGPGYGAVAVIRGDSGDQQRVGRE
jgi:hypothetical protein